MIYNPRYYAQGTDSVSAKLTPKEAVLNRNAAELMGRHNIAAANLIGNHLAQRGIDLPSMIQSAPTQAFAGAQAPQQTAAPAPQQMQMQPPPMQATPQTFPPQQQMPPQAIAPTQGFQTGASTVYPPPRRMFHNPLHYQSGTSYVPITDPNDPSLPINQRARYMAELKDPTVARQVYNLTHNEVGGQGPQAQQAFIETLFNRAGARNQTLAQTINDKNYYPASSFKPVTLYPDQEAHYASLVDRVAQGSNVSNNATGNASGDVGFGGGPTTYAAGGERFGIEKPDLPKLQAQGLQLQQYGTVPYAPTDAAGGSSGDLTAQAEYAAGQGSQAATQTDENSPWRSVMTASQQFGEAAQKQAASQENTAESRMSAAISNVPTSNPLLAQLGGDPMGPLRQAIALSMPNSNVSPFSNLFDTGGEQQ